MRVTVMGLGLFGGGEGAARHFAGGGHEVTVTDLRSETILAPSVRALAGLPVRFVLGRHEEADFACDLLVVNQGVKPGNPLVEIARRSGARVTTEFELGLEAAALKRARAVAVTGSNGKSTTVEMLASIMRASGRSEAVPRGNSGGSLLADAASLPDGAALALEVSSFQLHRLSAFPGLEVALVTNLAPNHIDWHGALGAYYADKRKLIEMLPPGGVAVLNAADPILAGWGDALECVIWFGESSAGKPRAVWPEDGRVMARVDGEARAVADISAMRGRGPHDAPNAAAAAAAAIAFGIDAAAVAKGLADFAPLEHRLEPVGRVGGLTFVNDSAATTPESAVLALQAVSGPVAAIVGGYDKGPDYSALGRELARRADVVVLLGAAGLRIGEALRLAGGATPKVLAADTLEAAFAAAVKSLAKGTVLLSPAAASLDQFANYIERGLAFRRCVAALGAADAKGAADARS